MNGPELASLEFSGLLDERCVVVTGAARGIGAAIADACERASAQVFRLDATPGEHIIDCDVSDEDSVKRAFDRVSADRHIDDVIHAAGIATIGRVDETTVAEFQRVIDVNLVGSFIVAREAARRLSTGGHLIFIASQAGLKGGGLWGAYSASKGGVLRLADCLVEELGDNGVRVNSISPGSVETEMSRSAMSEIARRSGTSVDTTKQRYIAQVPLGRLAEAEEVGRAVVAVCSGLLTYMNGANLVLDGGELSR